MLDKPSYQPTPETENKEKWLEELNLPETRQLLLRYVVYLQMKFSPEECEDVTQDALLKATEAVKKDQFDGSRAKLITWLQRIAKNTAVDLLRKKKYRSIMGPLPETYQFTDKGPTPAENYIAVDIVKKLKPHFDELPPKQQAVIKLLDSGLTTKQIAERLGVPLNTVKSRGRDALAYLKKRIEDKK